MIKIIECPRDGMQGINEFIPSHQKIEYQNSLLKVGFDTIDFGSFVSAKAIPQMSDTEVVLKGLDLSETQSKLLAIVVNFKGALKACSYDEVDYLGFPFSISPTFLQNNIKSDLGRSILLCNQLQNLCLKHKKELVVYISMAFGNPYADKWSIGYLIEWVDILDKLGVKIIALSDTTGESNKKDIDEIFTSLIGLYPHIEFGFHMHTTADTWYEKLDAAYKAGCRRFDTVMNGIGGCPLSGKEMLGNLDTSNLLEYFKSNGIPTTIDKQAFNEAQQKASFIFK